MEAPAFRGCNSGNACGSFCAEPLRRQPPVASGTPIENLAEAAATLPSVLFGRRWLLTNPIALCAACPKPARCGIAYANHLIGSAGAHQGRGAWKLALERLK